MFTKKILELMFVSFFYFLHRTELHSGGYKQNVHGKIKKPSISIYLSLRQKALALPRAPIKCSRGKISPQQSKRRRRSLSATRDQNPLI